LRVGTRGAGGEDQAQGFDIRGGEISAVANRERSGLGADLADSRCGGDRDDNDLADRVGREFRFAGRETFHGQAETFSEA
jgi:hypothetical protein